MPHVRKLKLGPRADPDEIVVSVWIPRAANDLRSIDGSLPELRRELTKRWPVKSIHRSRRMRNPADPTHWELNFIVELAKPFITEIGKAVVNGAVRWFRKRFPGSKRHSKQHKKRTILPTTEHKIGLMMVENRAFIERIAWYSVGIVNVFADVDHQKKTKADGLGTGTACMWNGHRLILTAEHVVANAKPKDLAFLLRVDEAINWEGSGKPEQVQSRVSLPVERIVRWKEHDLAAIVLDGSDSRMQFSELPEHLAKRRTTRRKGSLILLGYPTDRIFTYSKARTAAEEANYYAVRPTILTGTIAKAPSSALSSSYHPKRDVLLHYTPEDSKMKPWGFSGAAAWSDSAERQGTLWTAEPMIFGVLTHAFMTSKRLLLVGAPTIKKLLKEAFGSP
jgi:Trypsin-like peptidase domain